MRKSHEYNLQRSLAADSDGLRVDATEVNQGFILLPYTHLRRIREPMMEKHESKPRVAQPADEEIKKHGDQLAKQVKDAASEPVEQNSDKHGDDQIRD